MSTPTTQAEPRWTVEGFASFWADPDINHVKFILTDDVTGYWTGRDEPYRGKDEYAGCIAALVGAVPGVRVEINEHAESGPYTSSDGPCTAKQRTGRSLSGAWTGSGFGTGSSRRTTSFSTHGPSNEPPASLSPGCERYGQVGRSEEAKMPFTITSDAFDSEADAIREIEARGWHAMTFPAPAEVSEWHWHDFEALIFMLDGTMTIEFEDGHESFECAPGCRIETADRVVHREVTDGYRAVFGLSVDPATLTMPINKPAAELVNR